MKYTLSNKNIQVLITYAEHDVYDYTRRATAFSFIEVTTLTHINDLIWLIIPTIKMTRQKLICGYKENVL